MVRIIGNFDGFKVWIYESPREHHYRPHVHMFRGEYEVSIALPTETGTIEVLKSSRAMPMHLIRKAAQVVEDHAKELRKEWDRLHGTR